MRSVPWLLVALAALPPVSHQDVASPPVTTMRVLVTRDEDRVPVAGLTRGDFVINLPGSIVSVSPLPAESPVSLAVLIDVSASLDIADFYVVETLESGLLDLRTLGRRSDVATILDPSLVSAIGPGDRVRVASMGRRLLWSPWFERAGYGFASALATTLRAPRGERFGPSPLWDLIDEAVSSMAREPGWRNIVLLTDGRATGNVKGADEVIRRAALSDVTIHVVEAGWLVHRDRTDFNQSLMIDAAAANLMRLSAATGGLYRPRRLGPLVQVGSRRAPPIGPIVREVFEAIHQGYVVSVSGLECGERSGSVSVHVTSVAGAVVHFPRALRC